MVKVRFNLSAGKYFMKWKIEYPNKVVEYYEPSEVQLVMLGCQLKNHKTTAKKIHDGAHKTVCAWVMCDSVHIIRIVKDYFIIDDGYCRVSYNPRVSPYWVNDNGDNIDGTKYRFLISNDRKLFANEKREGHKGQDRRSDDVHEAHESSGQICF
jgi:hypothetical protein